MFYCAKRNPFLFNSGKSNKLILADVIIEINIPFFFFSNENQHEDNNFQNAIKILFFV